MRIRPLPGIADRYRRGRRYREEQVAAIIRTDSTCTRCALVDEELPGAPELVAEPAPLDVEPAAPAVEPAAPAVEPVVEPDPDALLELDSRRPRISTWWFACCRSSLLSPSRMYVEPLVPLMEPLLPDPVAPALPVAPEPVAVEPLPVAAPPEVLPVADPPEVLLPVVDPAPAELDAELEPI